LLVLAQTGHCEVPVNKQFRLVSIYGPVFDKYDYADYYSIKYQWSDLEAGQNGEGAKFMLEPSTIDAKKYFLSMEDIQDYKNYISMISVNEDFIAMTKRRCNARRVRGRKVVKCEKCGETCVEPKAFNRRNQRANFEFEVEELSGNQFAFKAGNGKYACPVTRDRYRDGAWGSTNDQGDYYRLEAACDEQNEARKFSLMEL